eukprot:COSAG05_NODE_119_length_17779_cov_273.146049_12_plen_262_part_00
MASERCVGAFRAAFSEASRILEGGKVYDGQNVRGLSDVDAAAPLVATLRLCSGEVVELGPEPRRRFLAQSCFKPLTFAMALETGLGGDVAAAVGARGDAPFGTFELAQDGRALNPLINSGALCVLELLSHSHSEEDIGHWCRSVGTSAGSLDGECFDDVAVAATVADSLRNRGLSCQLASRGVLPKTEDAVDRAVRYYAALDCLLTDTTELARVACAFAGPAGAEGHDLSAATRTQTLSMMLHCGMYPTPDHQYPDARVYL